MFENIIGQKNVKKKLKFFIDAQHKTGVSPNIIFVAPKGCGKTMMAEAYANELRNRDSDRRQMAYVNCSTIKNLPQVMEHLIIPCVSQNRECSIFLDEASEIPRDVSMALLTILNPNRRDRNMFTYDGDVIEFDFRRTTFLFATTEAHQVFHALMDRLERVDLEEYTLTELSEIVRLESTLDISDEVISEIMPIARGNGRDAVLLAKKINKWHVNNPKAKNFGGKEWEDLSDTINILPLGLNHNEIKLLKILEERPVTTLTGLSARTMMSKTSLQKDIELYLQKQNLIEIVAKGRRLTSKGREYLQALRSKAGE